MNQKMPLTIHFPRESVVISGMWASVVIEDPEEFLMAALKHLESKEPLAIVRIKGSQEGNE